MGPSLCHLQTMYDPKSFNSGDIGSLALPDRCSQGYLPVTVSDQAAMWFGLYRGFLIRSGGCSSQRPQHTEQGRPMQTSIQGVNEEPGKDGQQGCARGAGRGEVHGREGAERCRREDPLRRCRRKTRSACNSKGRCSFSIHYLYETTTSLSFHPTTNIVEGGAWGVRVPRRAVGLRPVTEPPGR